MSPFDGTKQGVLTGFLPRTVLYGLWAGEALTVLVGIASLLLIRRKDIAETRRAESSSGTRTAAALPNLPISFHVGTVALTARDVLAWVNYSFLASPFAYT